MTSCGIAPEDDDGNAASRRQPDVAMILKGIATSSTMKILTANFNNAMQMLGEEHREEITHAASKRKAELTQKEEA